MLSWLQKWLCDQSVLYIVPLALRIDVRVAPDNLHLVSWTILGVHGPCYHGDLLVACKFGQAQNTANGSNASFLFLCWESSAQGVNKNMVGNCVLISCGFLLEPNCHLPDKCLLMGCRPLRVECLLSAC